MALSVESVWNKKRKAWARRAGSRERGAKSQGLGAASEKRIAENPKRNAERGGRMGDQIFCDAVIVVGIFYLGACLCLIACPPRGLGILRWSRKREEKTENRRYS
jgi:hypothetical protein